MNIHRVTIGGRLGKDPELKNFESGTSVCNLSVATNDYKKEADGSFSSKTIWHNVSVWGKKAQWVVANLKKGDKVYVEGKNDYQEWKDENGATRSSIKIKASLVESLGPEKNQKEVMITEEDLPF